jgi:hypothetical protein
MPVFDKAGHELLNLHVLQLFGRVAEGAPEYLISKDDLAKVAVFSPNYHAACIFWPF